MSTPQEELVEGIEHLRPMMEANGFEFSLGETGIGSGGTFAVGQFQRDDRILAFSVRYGLGLVEYTRVRQLRSQVLVFARAHFHKCHYNSANCSGAAGFSIPNA